MAHGTVDWFQVDTDDPDGAERFYGELFNWTFAPMPDGSGYRLVTRAGAEHPHGGIFDTKGETPDRAVFFVVVSDVDTAVERAERLGGKVVRPPTADPSGLRYADLLDPSGNHFSVYTPPQA